jgi:hypothetical protein
MRDLEALGIIELKWRRVRMIDESQRSKLSSKYEPVSLEHCHPVVHCEATNMAATADAHDV